MGFFLVELLARLFQKFFRKLTVFVCLPLALLEAGAQLVFQLSRGLLQALMLLAQFGQFVFELSLAAPEATASAMSRGQIRSSRAALCAVCPVASIWCRTAIILRIFSEKRYIRRGSAAL